MIYFSLRCRSIRRKKGPLYLESVAWLLWPRTKDVRTSVWVASLTRHSVSSCGRRAGMERYMEPLEKVKVDSAVPPRAYDACNATGGSRSCIEELKPKEAALTKPGKAALLAWLVVSSRRTIEASCRDNRRGDARSHDMRRTNDCNLVSEMGSRDWARFPGPQVDLVLPLSTHRSRTPHPRSSWAGHLPLEVR